MTTAQYITITLIVFYAYFAGLCAQIEQQRVYGYEEDIDFFYPITTGFWLMIHAFYTGLALLLEISVENKGFNCGIVSRSYKGLASNKKWTSHTC